MPKIEWRIDAGHMLSILMLLIGAVALWIKLDSEVIYLKEAYADLRQAINFVQRSQAGLDRKVTRLETQMEERKR